MHQEVRNIQRFKVKRKWIKIYWQIIMAFQPIHWTLQPIYYKWTKTKEMVNKIQFFYTVPNSLLLSNKSFLFEGIYDKWKCICFHSEMSCAFIRNCIGGTRKEDENYFQKKSDTRNEKLHNCKYSPQINFVPHP